MRILFVFLAVIILCTTGCHRRYLQCRTEYLTPQFLASERISTPDGTRKCFYGQELIVHWNLPVARIYPDTRLVVKVRYGTRNMNSLEVPITKPFGYWTYKLINDDYWRTGGVISYQATLWNRDKIIEQWNQALWSDIIEINES